MTSSVEWRAVSLASSNIGLFNYLLLMALVVCAGMEVMESFLALVLVRGVAALKLQRSAFLPSAAVFFDTGP